MDQFTKVAEGYIVSAVYDKATGKIVTGSDLDLTQVHVVEQRVFDGSTRPAECLIIQSSDSVTGRGVSIATFKSLVDAVATQQGDYKGAYIEAMHSTVDQGYHFRVITNLCSRIQMSIFRQAIKVTPDNVQNVIEAIGLKVGLRHCMSTDNTRVVSSFTPTA